MRWTARSVGGARRFHLLLFSSKDGRGQADDCTSGFMSLDRMNAVLGNYDAEDLETGSEKSVQAIVPGINFTCAGSILSWTLAAEWWDAAPALTELQIWRSSGDGSYTKVGSTTIMTEENTTGFYQYPLSSPLPFQAGDILGYFRSQLRLQFEDVGSGHLLYYNYQDNAASQFTVSDSTPFDEYHVLISVETGEQSHYYFTDCFMYNYMLIRPSRLWVWFHECGEDDDSTGTGDCWKCY